METENLEKLFEDLRNGHYEDVDIYLSKSIKEFEQIKSARFWSNWIYPNGATAEQVQDELVDYHMILEEVAKVYDHVTGGKISKQNTKAYEVISVADDVLQEKIEDALYEYKETLEFVVKEDSEPE